MAATNGTPAWPPRRRRRRRYDIEYLFGCLTVLSLPLGWAMSVLTSFGLIRLTTNIRASQALGGSAQVMCANLVTITAPLTILSALALERLHRRLRSSRAAWAVFPGAGCLLSGGTLYALSGFDVEIYSAAQAVAGAFVGLGWASWRALHRPYPERTRRRSPSLPVLDRH